jgi:hypothetical protein
VLHGVAFPAFNKFRSQPVPWAQSMPPKSPNPTESRPAKPPRQATMDPFGNPCEVEFTTGILNQLGKRPEPPFSTRRSPEADRHCPHYSATRHGEVFSHFLNSCLAQAMDLSLWHEVHGFGIPVCSVRFGVMNRKVCAAT